MADSSIAYNLTFSQEQLRAFVTFKETGCSVFYKHYRNFNAIQRWGNVCLLLSSLLLPI